MPVFFFDVRAPAGLEVDDLGTAFSSLEAAYLDACAAVVDISSEMLRERRDPTHLVFEVRDASGVLVMELPFREVLEPGHRRPPPVRIVELHQEVQARLARNRELQGELRASFEKAQTLMEQCREVMRRSHDV